MEPADIILYIGLIIFISHLFTSFFESTRIPDVLLLIILGILLNLLGFDPTPFFISADILFEIALAIVLFPQEEWPSIAIFIFVFIKDQS